MDGRELLQKDREKALQAKKAQERSAKSSSAITGDIKDRRGRTAPLPGLNHAQRERQTTAMPGLEDNRAEGRVTKKMVLEEIDGEIEFVKNHYSDITLVGLETGRHYKISGEPIGFGGTAGVYPVICDEDKKKYAAKIYQSGYKNDHIDEFFETFKNRKVEGLLPIIDRGEVATGRNQSRFYIMPFRKEENLWQYLMKHDMTEEEIILFIRTMNETLHALHEEIFFHRDVKPENILYDPVKKIPILLDYGSITRGDIRSGFDMAITTNRQRTEGYTAPEIHGLHSTTEGKEVIASAKTDFFSLGAVIAEIFKIREKKLKKSLHGNRNETKLFADDTQAFLSSQSNRFVFPENLLKNERFENLVHALLLYDPENRAGYDEICAWLEGRELVIDQNDYRERFKYNFNGKDYDSKRDLAYAMGTYWNAGLKEVNRGTLLRCFQEKGNSYKADADRIIQIEEDYQEMGDMYDDAKLLEIISYMGVDMPFIWKGKAYDDGEGKTDWRQVAEMLYQDAENSESEFDELVLSRGIKELLFENLRFVTDDAPNEHKEQVHYEESYQMVAEINKMAESSLELAKYYVAEYCHPGFLEEKLSGGSTRDVHTYLKSIFTSKNFDAAMKDIYESNEQTSNSMLYFLNSYLNKKVIQAMFMVQFELNHLDGSDQIEKVDDNSKKLLLLLINLLDIDRKGSSKNLGIEKAFLQSDFHKAVIGFIKNHPHYVYQDKCGYSAAEKLKKKVSESLQNIADITSKLRKDSSRMAEIISREYIPEFIEILDVVERIKMLFIYDKELLASGIVCSVPADGENLCSSIRAKNSQSNLCLVAGKYLVPENVAKKIYEPQGISIAVPEQQNEARKLSMEVSEKRVKEFFNSLQNICGVDIYGIAEVKKGILWRNFVLLTLAMVIGIGLVLSGIAFGLSRPFSAGLVEKKFGIFCIIVNIVLGGIILFGHRLTFKAAIFNLSLYKQNVNLYEHFHKIQETNNILNSMTKTGKLQVLETEEREIVNLACEHSNAAEIYCQKYNLSGYRGNYFGIRIAPVIFVGIVGALCFIISVLPVKNLTGALFASNLEYSMECAEKSRQLSGVLSSLNGATAKLSLNITESKITNYMLDLYNDGKIGEDKYKDDKELYYSLCGSFDYALGPDSKKAIDGIVESKKSFKKGNEYIKKKNLNKAIPYFLNVIPEDTDYYKAQEYISERINNLYKKQQAYIESGNEKKLAGIIKKYGKMLSGNVDGNILQDQYDILKNNNLKDAARKLAAYQLYLNKELWEDDDITISCVKHKTGLYYLLLKKKNHGFSSWVSKYKYRYYAVSTYDLGEDDDIDRSEEEFPETENAESNFSIADYLQFVPE